MMGDTLVIQETPVVVRVMGIGAESRLVAAGEQAVTINQSIPDVTLAPELGEGLVVVGTLSRMSKVTPADSQSVVISLEASSMVLVSTKGCLTVDNYRLL